MDWTNFENNLWSGLVAGIVAGIFLLLLEFLIRRHEKKTEKADSQIIHFRNESREVTGTIFNYLAPGSSIEMMKSELGAPNKKYKAEIGMFSIDITSSADDMGQQGIDAYLYLFRNAHVKVLSRDGETIDALTVIALDTNISMNTLPMISEERESEEFLNVAKVDASFISAGSDIESFPGCRDVFTAIRTFSGSLYRTYITYFCDFNEYDSEENLVANPNAVIGSVINGICLSSRPGDASYIYLSELI